MAVVAVPVAEGLGALIARGLAALGIAALAHEATKAAPKARTRDCADTADESQCNQCQLQEGRIGQASQPRYVVKKTRINYDYQLYIANLHAGPERFFFVKYGDNANQEVNLTWELTKDLFVTADTYTTLEWNYMGVWFDGFWRSLCTVVEAKGNYDPMLKGGSGGAAKPWARKVLSQWKIDLGRQLTAIAPAAPQGKLEWHFMQLLSYESAIRAGLPTTIARHTAMPMRGL